MWESNPPRQLLATGTGVEDQGAHQHASTPMVVLLLQIIRHSFGNVYNSINPLSKVCQAQIQNQVLNY